MTATSEPAAAEPACDAGVIWPREGGTVHTCALTPHQGGMHYDGGILHWFEARPADPCAECETLQGRVAQLEADLIKARADRDSWRRIALGAIRAGSWDTDG